jgi:hypothetical protein
MDCNKYVLLPFVSSSVSHTLLTSYTVQQGTIARLKAEGNHSSDEVWLEVLKTGLVVGTPNQDHAPEILGLEVIPTIGKDGNLSLVFRRNVGELIVSNLRAMSVPDTTNNSSNVSAILNLRRPMREVSRPGMAA